MGHRGERRCRDVRPNVVTLFAADPEVVREVPCPGGMILGGTDARAQAACLLGMLDCHAAQ